MSEDEMRAALQEIQASSNGCGCRCCIHSDITASRALEGRVPWTTTPPTKPGVYFAKWAKFDEVTTVTVAWPSHTKMFATASSDHQLEAWTTERLSYGLSVFSLWSGPIEPPALPT